MYCSNTDVSRPVPAHTNGMSFFFTIRFFFGSSPSTGIASLSSRSSISSTYACSNDSTPCTFSRVFTFTGVWSSPFTPAGTSFAVNRAIQGLIPPGSASGIAYTASRSNAFLR